MIHFIETHGFEVLVSYFLLISILGTLPDLPPNATYFQKWGFAIAHAICGNAKNMMASINQKVTIEPNSTTTKTEVKQTTIENKTEDK